MVPSMTTSLTRMSIRKYVAYKPPKSSCGVKLAENVPRTVTYHFPDSGECPPTTYHSNDLTGLEGTATVEIGPRQSAEDYPFCTITIDVIDGNCGTDVIKTVGVVGFADPTGDEFDMPRIQCATDSTTQGSDIFIAVYLECSDDDACLTDAY